MSIAHEHSTLNKFAGHVMAWLRPNTTSSKGCRLRALALRIHLYAPCTKPRRYPPRLAVRAVRKFEYLGEVCKSHRSDLSLHMQALKELEYPEKLQRLLLTPQREVLVELVITKDNGEIETFNAYRVQHDDSRGPYKGGLRYHPQVDLDDVRRCVGMKYALRRRVLSPASQFTPSSAS